MTEHLIETSLAEVYRRRWYAEYWSAHESTGVPWPAGVQDGWDGILVLKQLAEFGSGRMQDTIGAFLVEQFLEWRLTKP